jgi:hypothetical protein
MNNTCSQEQMIRDMAELIVKPWGWQLEDLCSRGHTFLRKGGKNSKADARSHMIYALRRIMLAGKPRWSYPMLQRALFGGSHSTVITAEQRCVRIATPEKRDAIVTQALAVWEKYRQSGNQQHKQAG